MPGACPGGGARAEIVRRIARKIGRSPETVRYTLKQFDQENADMAIFPDYHGPIRPVNHLHDLLPVPSRRVGRVAGETFLPTRASIYRIIAEMRAAQIAELPLDFIPNDDFAKALRAAKREQQILGRCRKTMSR